MKKTSAAAAGLILAGVELLSPHQAQAGEWKTFTIKQYPDLDPCIGNGKLKLDQGPLGFIAPEYYLDVQQAPVDDIQIQDHHSDGSPMSPAEIAAQKAAGKYECHLNIGGDIGTITRVNTPASILTEAAAGPLFSVLSGGTTSLFSVGTTVGATVIDGITRQQKVLIEWENKNYCHSVTANTPGTKQIGAQWVYVLNYDGKNWRVCLSNDGKSFGGMTPAEDTPSAALPTTPALTAGGYASTAAGYYAGTTAPATPATPARAPIGPAQQVPVAPVPQATTPISAPTSLLPTGGLSPRPAPAAAAPVRPAAAITWTFEQYQRCAATPAPAGCE